MMEKIKLKLLVKVLILGVGLGLVIFSAQDLYRLYLRASQVNQQLVEVHNIWLKKDLIEQAAKIVVSRS
jgi:hypothetical protein